MSMTLRRSQYRRLYLGIADIYIHRHDTLQSPNQTAPRGVAGGASVVYAAYCAATFLRFCHFSQARLKLRSVKFLDRRSSCDDPQLDAAVAW